jgi:hypothetical protein
MASTEKKEYSQANGKANRRANGNSAATAQEA